MSDERNLSLVHDPASSTGNIFLDSLIPPNDAFLLKFPHFNFPQDKSDKPSSQDRSPVYGKDIHHPSGFNVGYLVSPYTYANGAAGALPVSMVSLHN